jgi:hypothetical protein
MEDKNDIQRANNFDTSIFSFHIALLKSSYYMSKIMCLLVIPSHHRHSWETLSVARYTFAKMLIKPNLILPFHMLLGTSPFAALLFYFNFSISRDWWTQYASINT